MLGRRADGSEEAVHSRRDGSRAAGTQPVQGASDGAAGGRAVGRDAEGGARASRAADQETLVCLELVCTDTVVA